MMMMTMMMTMTSPEGVVKNSMPEASEGGFCHHKGE